MVSLLIGIAVGQGVLKLDDSVLKYTKPGFTDSKTEHALPISGDGTLVIEFVDCTNALATYEITSLDISGVIPLERIVSDNVPLCLVLANP